MIRTTLTKTTTTTMSRRSIHRQSFLQRGENESLEYSSTEDALVDLFFQLVRTMPEGDLVDKVRGILQSAQQAEEADVLADLVVLAFQTRDCRGGKGEKKLFYGFVIELFKAYPETMLSLMGKLADYGYGKDLIAIFDMCESSPFQGSDQLTDKVCEVFAAQLLEDKATLDARAIAGGGGGAKPSLTMLAKYAPRKGCAFASFRKKLQHKLFGDAHDASKSYRQLVVSLTSALDVPEALMCTGRYDEVDFKKVPSLCLNRNRKAFLNEKMLTTEARYPEDAKRIACRDHLIANAIAGNVTGKVLMPHELVTKVGSVDAIESLVIDAQWGKVKEGVLEQLAKFATKAPAPGAINLGKLCPLVDVSGSMSGEPMEVAIALGILVSELSDPAFKDRFITFESQPKWVSLAGLTSLKDKVLATRRAPWGGSTNFNAAIGMILDVAVSAKLAPEDIPDLIVFSDMQFDDADSAYNGTMYDNLVRRFAEAGMSICGFPYRVPKIIFWNLRSTGGYPVGADTPNTQLLSGFSPSLLKLVLNGECMEVETEEVMADGTVLKVKSSITPKETLRKCLDDERYFAIREVLSASTEGLFAQYSFEKPLKSSGNITGNMEEETSVSGGAGGAGGESDW